MTRPSTIAADLAVLLVAILAFVVAVPWTRGIVSAFLPALEFAIGAAMVTLAFLQVARAASAWLARTAPLPWLGAGLTVALGLFVAGSSQMLDAPSHDFNWVSLGGIAVVIAGAEWQRRSALR